MPHNQSETELLKIANERLWPSLTNPSYLVQRRRRLLFSEWMKRVGGDRLLVLDIGGRYQPYRPILGDRVARYIALDVLPTVLVSVVGNGQQLPFKAETFDLVIATGVFEYFQEPLAASKEIHRILKRGGYLMMSVASVCPRAVDEEHWRYLPAGLRYILKPFATHEIVPEVTSVGGFLRVTSSSLSIFSKYGFLRWMVHHSIVPMLNIAGLLLDRPGISTNDQVAGNFSVLAQK